MNGGARAHTHAHTHTSCISGQAMGLKKSFFLKVFKEDLKELTEAEWRTETGGWFQITGAW